MQKYIAICKIEYEVEAKTIEIAREIIEENKPYVNGCGAGIKQGSYSYKINEEKFEIEEIK